MHNTAMTKRPVCEFGAPPNAPAAWQQVHEPFVAAVGRLLDAEERRDELKEQRDALIAEAKAKQVEAARAGEVITVSLAGLVRKIDDEIADAEAAVAALYRAVDQLGNDAAEAIPAIRPEWIAANEARIEPANQRWHAAITELRAAAAERGQALAAVKWLEEFDVVQARSGNVPRMGAVVTCDIQRLSKNDSTPRVDAVLDVLDAAF